MPEQGLTVDIEPRVHLAVRRRHVTRLLNANVNDAVEAWFTQQLPDRSRDVGLHQLILGKQLVEQCAP